MTRRTKPITVFLFFAFCSLCLAKEAIKQVCFENVCVQAEIADTKDKRKTGLMFRESLPKNQGMLFIFDREESHSFWMKNMRIPLDIIYICQDKRIVDIKADVAPCRDSCYGLAPGAKAKYVLEVNAGFAEENKIEIGDKARF